MNSGKNSAVDDLARRQIQTERNFWCEVLKCLVKITTVLAKNKKAQLSLTNPARRESLPKITPIRRAYNVVTDDTGLPSFV